MIRRLVNWVGQRNFHSGFVRAAEKKYTSGELSFEKYRQCLKAAKNPSVMRRARRQLRADPNLLGGISDWDWQAIYEWFVENFLPALEVIMSLFLLVAEEEK